MKSYKCIELVSCCKPKSKFLIFKVCIHDFYITVFSCKCILTLKMLFVFQYLLQLLLKSSAHRNLHFQALYSYSKDHYVNSFVFFLRLLFFDYIDT